MYKILVVCLSVILAFTVTISPVNHVDAFASKLLGMSAKKIAKEVVKDMAVESATNFALNEAFKIADAQMAKYEQQENYKIVCLSRMTGEVCDKPVSVKENLTEADKIAIAHQAEIELDNAVSPSGTGFTKWQKFLDWFGPVWITGAIMTAITYAIDSDVRSLFNEIGYKALVALGFIKEVNSNEKTALKDIPITEPLPNETYTRTPAGHITVLKTNYVENSSYLMEFGQTLLANSISEMRITNPSNVATYKMNPWIAGSHIIVYPTKIEIAKNYFPSITSVTLHKNGVAQSVTTSFTTSSDSNIYTFEASSDFSVLHSQIESIRTRFPYQVDGFWYTDMLFSTVNGDYYELQIKTPEHRLPLATNYIGSAVTYKDTALAKTDIRTTLYVNQPQKSKILPPPFAGNETDLDLMENGSRTTEDGKTVLVPPAGLPYTQITTGEPLTITPNPTPGGEPILTNPQGETVPEDDVTVGDPNVTKDPQGVPQVTPQPTPSAPAPAPIPLTPAPPTSPPTTEPPPPPEDGGGGKPNIPMGLLLGLFKLLFAIIFYLIRMFTFIVTIQFIEPTPILNPYFQWFTTVEILGIKPYPLVKNLALFFLSFSIYKSIRRVFG